jgi:hypothetical protein
MGEDGYRMYVCVVCGNWRRQNEINKLEMKQDRSNKRGVVCR